MKKYKLIVLTLLVSFLIPLGLFAAEEGGKPEGLTVSPPLAEYEIKQGESVTKKIKVTNPVNRQVKVYPTSLDFTAKGETGEPDFIKPGEERKSYSLASWISFSKSYLLLEPQEVEEFEFTIKIPNDAEPGGHYGVVFFSSEPPAPEGTESQVTISTMVGSLLLVKVPGYTVEKAELETFSAPSFLFKSPVPFVLRVSNIGNVHVKPRGDIIIKDIFGKEVDSIKANPTDGNVLPETIRKFEPKWEPKSSLLYPIGRYTAELKLTYGDSQKEVTAFLSFWIIPLWLIILVIVLLVVIIVFIVYRKRKKGGKGLGNKNNHKNVLDLRK